MVVTCHYHQFFNILHKELSCFLVPLRLDEIIEIVMTLGKTRICTITGGHSECELPWWLS